MISKKGKICYRFASDKILREFQLPVVPTSAGDVRALLKKKLSISAPLDVVLYRLRDGEKTARLATADSAVVNDGQKFVAKRVPASLAKAILKAALESEKIKLDRANNSAKPASVGSEEISSKGSSSIADVYDGLELLSDSDDDGDDLPEFEPKSAAAPTAAVPQPSNALPNAAAHSLQNSSQQQHSVSTSASVQCSSTSPVTPSPNVCSISPSSLSPAAAATSSTEAPVSTLVHIPVGKPAAVQNNELLEFNPETDFDDADEDTEEDEQLLIQKIISMEQPTGMSQSPYSHGRNPRLQNSSKPKDSLASRYYRSCNMSWSKGDPERPTANWSPANGRPMGPGRPPFNGGFRRPPAEPVIVSVRENYVCHICGEKGHHIKNCPKGHDPKKQKKVKPSTGLPRSWLQRISDDKIAQYEGDVYCLPDGTFAVLKPFATAASASLSQPVESKIRERFGAGSQNIADHLRCTLCLHLFNAPVLTPCCGETFCRSCVLSRLSLLSSSPDNDDRAAGASSMTNNQTTMVDTANGSSGSGGSSSSTSDANSRVSRGQCPSCQEMISSVDLEENKVIQETVEGVLRVGRLDTAILSQSSSFTTPTASKHNSANENNGASVGGGSMATNAPSSDEKVAEKPFLSRLLPPGTIREVQVPVGGVMPLGRRLVETNNKNMKKRPSSTPMTNGLMVEQQSAAKKRQTVR